MDAARTWRRSAGRHQKIASLKYHNALKCHPSLGGDFAVSPRRDSAGTAPVRQRTQVRESRLGLLFLRFNMSTHQRRDERGWLLPSHSELPDFEEVRRLFVYSKITGLFERRITIGQRAKEGTVAGFMDSGRVYVRFRGKKVAAHRLAWLYVTSVWPRGEIDHINGDPTDNRFQNLRDVCRSTNMENQRLPRSDNKIGVLGVRLKQSGFFEARIWVKGKSIQLGLYKTAEEAHKIYVNAKRRLHQGCTI